MKTVQQFSTNRHVDSTAPLNVMIKHDNNNNNNNNTHISIPP